MHLRSYLGVLLGICVQCGCGADLPCDSATELREVAAPLIKRATPSKGPVESGAQREFIVDYLGSSDDALRGAAIELLSTGLLNGRPVRAAKFTDYLSQEHPPEVRAIALAYSLWGHTVRGEKRPQTDERVSAMKDVWAATINSLANQAGIPSAPWLSVVVGMTHVGDNVVSDLLTPDNRPRFAERIVPLLEGPEEWSSIVVSTVGGLGADVAAPVLEKWYRQEKDPSVRLVLVDNFGLLDLEDPGQRERFMPLLDLARADPDEDVRARAALTTR
ncbi:MAG TPA: hypothetical protein VEL07_22160 [Planctomycetota bacterium]|nr:hypothetical protein [Planctomycetota bacterium]